MLYCPRNRVPSFSSAPNSNLSSEITAGSTREPDGIPATLEKRKIAADREPKKVRAPAKKKLPMEPPVKSNGGLDCDCRIPL